MKIQKGTIYADTSAEDFDYLVSPGVATIVSEDGAVITLEKSEVAALSEKKGAFDIESSNGDCMTVSAEQMIELLRLI